ncbi:MAG TPA: hypothetical protein P5270_04975 [Victivallales bacterium]|nr:hypothetical protein [Victivallales bacterium]HPO90222.1 hypothetical protein [Victivallales bacterium]HRR28696.1 hypothetical protein [Victivallales bacterium]HRU00758.1 hypothetical protein [Victivallales bacterium]
MIILPENTFKISLIDEISIFSPYENMAIDEQLTLSRELALNNNSSLFLRFYTWKQKCITFGYAQNFHKVLEANPNINIIIRRPTGGGTVIHQNDLTYSMIIFNDSPLFSLHRNEIYLLLHNTIKKVLQRFNINSSLSTKKSLSSGYYKCFEKPVPGDLLLENGLKIAGAAQKQTKDYILVQGTIAIDLINLRIDVFKSALLDEFKNIIKIHFQNISLTEDFLSAARELADKKYFTEKWNKFRKI